MAYQGYGHGLGRDAVETLYRVVLDDFAPDLTLILDVPVAVGLERAGGRDHAEDRYERMDVSFHERLRAGFLDIASREPGRCAVIDATRPADMVMPARYWSIVSSRLPGWFDGMRAMGVRTTGEGDGPAFGWPAPSANPYFRRATTMRCGALRRCLCRAGGWPMPGCFAGPRGIGKATLAFRFARHILSDEASGAAGAGDLFAGSDAAETPEDMAMDRRNIRSFDGWRRVVTADLRGPRAPIGR